MIELWPKSRESKDQVDLIITGGDRYRSGGKIYSKSNNREIPNSNPNSFHLQENGALAVDIRESKFTDKQLKKAAQKAGLQFQAGYDDGHFHLEHDSQDAKEDYLNDNTIDKDFIPTDFELNRESEKIERLQSSLEYGEARVKLLEKRLDRRVKLGRNTGNLEERIELLKTVNQLRQNKLDRLNSFE